MTSRTRESYDELAATYVEHLYGELAGKPLDRHLLNRFAEGVAGRGKVADIGCGPGHVTRYLRERGVDAMGVDLSPGMIEQARRLAADIEFRVGDMRALELSDGALAGVVAFYSLIHIDAADMVPVLGELRRVLAPGGLLLASFHVGEETRHVEELWGHKVSLDFRFLAADEMVANMKSAGLEVLERVEREPYPGAEAATRRCYLLASPRAG